MAPITRSGAGALISHQGGLQPPRERYRETSWSFVGETDGRSEREPSEEPTSSYDEDMMSDGGDEDVTGKQLLLESPEDHEDILHPLREAANRVGREVEKFAEILDSYNPLRAIEESERYAMTLELIELYYGVAKDTVGRLREQHDTERRKRDGIRWRKKMRGFRIAQETDELEFDEDDEGEYPAEPNIQTTLEDLERWEQEAQTWDLLHRLVQARYPPPGSEAQKNQARTQKSALHKYSKECDLWEDFLETDELALERNTVLRWLKESAEDSSEDIDVLVQDLQQNADRGDIIAHGWLHTKAAIKNEKRLQAWPKDLDPSSPILSRGFMNTARTEPLITQLDPDAATRQSRHLEVQDKYFERAIWLGCWEMLRRGRSANEIREWCVERTEIWRAVSMSGLPGENMDNDQTADPESWSLWRRMCFALAHNGGGDQYERAVYGVLSGDISTVEPACRTWDDFIFANYNALLRTQFDNYLQRFGHQGSSSTIASNFSIFDAVQFHGDPQSAGARLVETLRSDPRTSKETQQPMKMLQGVLIANQFKHFIHQQGLALSKFANAAGGTNLFPVEKDEPDDLGRYVAAEDHDSLRVFTHVLLVFKCLGVDLGGAFKRTAVENVIVSYISFLRLAGKEELIPLYCSQLSGVRRYAILSRTLIDITDYDQRITQIKLMRELGLDVQEFVRMQAFNLLEDYPTIVNEYPAVGKFSLFDHPHLTNVTGIGRRLRQDFLGEEDKLERVDMLLIRSFEWYLLVDGMWSETFEVGTLLYLRFFKNMHLNAARILASRVSSSVIARSKTQALIGETLDFTALENGDDEDITEVLDGSAERKKLLRKHLLTEARNFRELEALSESLDYIETVSSLDCLMIEKKEDPAWQKNVRSQLARNVQHSRTSIPTLLNKWLLTSPNVELADEFTQLREAYLPETILAYITTLQIAGWALTRDFIMECMDLAALVAEEDSDLLQLFEKTDRMQELVEAFTAASKNLLYITSEKRSAGSKSKKMRIKGWTQELWSVKP
ncbi:107-domain-containing protein [Tricladium varicosporioides]|nr:107-domain-containing protein [Hymenoscyphus varicosporioides]